MSETKELTCFTRKDKEILRERTNWFYIRIHYFQIEPDKHIFFKNIKNYSVHDYVRLKYILGEPL